MSELKPCPFCGSSEIEEYSSTPDREGTPMGHFCTNCGAYGPWSYRCDGKPNPDDWNNRAVLSAPRVPDKKPMPDLMMATWHEKKAGTPA